MPDVTHIPAPVVVSASNAEPQPPRREVSRVMTIGFDGTASDLNIGYIRRLATL